LSDRDWQNRLADLKQRPRNRGFDEVAGLLDAAGFNWRRGKGSHRNFFHPNYEGVLPIPYRRRPLLIGYVRAATKAVEAARADALALDEMSNEGDE
jgi:predicted RNA binding protein YcfA (HicA-like mRNA interferase family)